MVQNSFLFSLFNPAQLREVLGGAFPYLLTYIYSVKLVLKNDVHNVPDSFFYFWLHMMSGKADFP